MIDLSLYTPGVSVLVARKGEAKPLWEKGFGLANLKTNAPCTPETNFRLASLTKQFTAMCVLILAEQGKVGLEDRLGAFFTGLPSWGEVITVKHLLTHTSGLIDYEDVIPAGTTVALKDRDVLEILRMAA